MSSSTLPHGTLPTTTRTAGDVVPTSSGQLTLDRGIVNASSASGAPPPGSNRKKQKHPKTKAGNQLSKSFSTPSLRGHIMSDSDLDKKRNKLGYQRISIACAHCRRRKIRCLLSEDNEEQRCQNCIRLKKECVFYPVDQQAALDARSEGSNKSGAPLSGPSSAVSTSPPQIGTRSFDQQSHPFGSGFQNVPQEGAQGFPGIAIPSSGLQMQGTYPAQDYSYSPQGQHGQQWAHQEYAMHSQRIPTNNNAHLQQPHSRFNNGVGADVAPFPSSEQHSPNVSQSESFPYTQEQAAQQWQQPQPVRSMSYNDNYDPSFAQQIPASYMRQSPYPSQPDHRMMQAAPGQASLHAHPHYMMPPDQRSSSVPGVSPFQQPLPQVPQNWYPDPSQQGGYSSRPG